MFFNFLIEWNMACFIALFHAIVFYMRRNFFLKFLILKPNLKFIRNGPRDLETVGGQNGAIQLGEAGGACRVGGCCGL